MCMLSLYLSSTACVCIVFSEVSLNDQKKATAYWQFIMTLEVDMCDLILTSGSSRSTARLSEELRDWQA